MNIEYIREFCLALPHTTEDLPFDEDTLVFRIAGKIFALCGIENFSSINLKCDPERAVELRERYNGVQPGYHMNKTHWNTVHVQSDVPEQLILELIEHSYNIVRSSLPKKVRDTLV